MSELAHERIATAKEAQDFYQEGMNQFDHLLLGQEEAKMGALVVIASGANVVFVGDPGGGKSTLVKNMHRVVGDINDNEVAIIPPMSDLTAQKVVGGKSESTRKTETQEGTSVETNSTVLSPVIDSTTKVIRADEINRGAPHAVNSMLEALEEGKVSNTAGEANLDNLLWAVSSMNPAEARQGVFQIPKAMASRHAVGVVLNGKDKKTVSEIFGGWNPKPEIIEPITDIETIQAIKNRVSNGIAIPREVQEPAVGRIMSANAKLQETGITDESPNRMAKQVSLIARAIAALNGQESINDQDVEEALKYVITARVGMLGRGDTTKTVDQILS